MILKSLFSFNSTVSPERSVYETIVAQARQPAFYAEWGVPDTLDGRFDMIILHVDAVMVHMQKGDPADTEFAQLLIDEVFRDMDRSLREMGVGDMGVGKRIKKMATVFYGRASAYDTARKASDDELQDAILRNVFAGDENMKASAAALVSYSQKLHAAVESNARDKIRSGVIDFADLAVEDLNG